MDYWNILERLKSSFFTVDGSLDPGRQLFWYIYWTRKKINKNKYLYQSTCLATVPKLFPKLNSLFQRQWLAMSWTNTPGSALYTVIVILISAIFVVRKLVKRRFWPKSAIRLSIVMLHCSYVSPSDSDQGFFFFFTAALKSCGVLGA